MKPLKLITCILAFVMAVQGQNISQSSHHPIANYDALVEESLPWLLTTYKMLHAAPELSHREEKTSAFFAAELRKLGFSVTERVGKFERPEWKGYGVVALMKNGPGPTVLLRTDIDALPVEEKTGLPYASTVKTRNDAGLDVSVMHACGHDIHMTSMLGTAKVLSETKNSWHGTLIILGQPAEETIDGARAVLRDGLYKNFPQPDFLVALHDYAYLETGKVGITPGYAMASATAVDIKIRGIGGHGSKPESTKDPVVIAAQVINMLQTIVSRENSPLDPAVVTVGSIHGGTRYNIIPDEVNLQLTVRTYKEEVRKRVLASIERITNGVAQAAGIPGDLAPIVEVSETEVTSATYNDPQLSERLATAFKKTLGNDNVVQIPPVMGSEDFGYLSLDQKIPAVLFWLGAVDALKLKQSRETGIPMPSWHSSHFAPVPESTLRTGVRAMTAAVLELMK